MDENVPSPGWIHMPYPEDDWFDSDQDLPKNLSLKPPAPVKSKVAKAEAKPQPKRNAMIDRHATRTVPGMQKYVT